MKFITSFVILGFCLFATFLLADFLINEYGPPEPVYVMPDTQPEVNVTLEPELPAPAPAPLPGPLVEPLEEVEPVLVPEVVEVQVVEVEPVLVPEVPELLQPLESRMESEVKDLRQAALLAYHRAQEAQDVWERAKGKANRIEESIALCEQRIREADRGADRRKYREILKHHQEALEEQLAIYLTHKELESKEWENKLRAEQEIRIMGGSVPSMVTYRNWNASKKIREK